MRKIRNYLRVLLAALFCMLSVWMVQAQEEDYMPALSDNVSGSLQVTMTAMNEANETETLSGVTLELFCVAEVKVEGGSAEYTLTDEFRDSGIVFAGMSASQSNTYAAVLSKLADTKSLSGVKMTTDENGQVFYTDLKPGMYLVRLSGKAEHAGLYVEMEPFLIAVPRIEKGAENSWQYEVGTQPKTAVTLHERQEEGTGSISVKKRVEILNVEGNQLLIAEDAVFYVGIFTDPEGKQLYGSSYVKPLHFVNRSSAEVTFENLPFGEYYVFETDFAGNAITPSKLIQGSDGEYVCLFDEEEQKVVLTVNNDSGEVNIANVYIYMPVGYSMIAKIRIEKQVLDGEEQVTAGETFYAGVFTKDENEEYHLYDVVELTQNGTVDVYVPWSGDEGDETEYWVFETDKNGNRIDPDSFGYLIDGETSITINSKHPNGTVTLINTLKTSDEPAAGDTEGTADPRDTKESDLVPEGVKTGDNTQILLYLQLFAFAGVAAVYALVRKKRKC